MRFKNEFVSRENRFTVGVDSQSGDHFVSIPVRNSKVEYSEYYRLTDAEYQLFRSDFAQALSFAQECKQRLHDDRLILPPGSERGDPE